MLGNNLLPGDLLAAWIATPPGFEPVPVDAPPAPLRSRHGIEELIAARFPGARVLKLETARGESGRWCADVAVMSTDNSPSLYFSAKHEDRDTALRALACGLGAGGIAPTAVTIDAPEPSPSERAALVEVAGAADHFALVAAACAELAKGLDLRSVRACILDGEGVSWADLAHDVARTSRGDVDRNDFDALAKALRAMGAGDVDGAARALARLEDCDITVADWYAQERAAKGGV